MISSHYSFISVDSIKRMPLDMCHVCHVVVVFFSNASHLYVSLEGECWKKYGHTVIRFPCVLDEITQQLLLVDWENFAVDINIINVGLCTGDN